eukprot:scaffold2322_cov135-Cylindrotheca_fusiformis.AAC.30
MAFGFTQTMLHLPQPSAKLQSKGLLMLSTAFTRSFSVLASVGLANIRTMSSTPASFTAMLIEDAGNKKTKSSLQTLKVEDLPPYDVLVKVEYSTLNYKDGLAIAGKGRICRRLPMVGGIDLAGTVVSNESSDSGFKEGDRVVVNGFGMSETEWGGYSGYAKLKPEWLVNVPEAFSLEQAMGIGTAGYTSMLCVNAIRDHGVTPDDGPILVTGASGGVGSVAVHLLSKLGYQVHASSGRPSTHEYLKSLGATAIIDRKDLDRDSKPLEKEVWAGSVDTVGSKTLASVIAQTKYGGVVTACGLVGGMDLPSSVAPFILRGVALQGIDSVMAPREKRERAWKDLAELLDPSVMKDIYKVEPMSELPKLAEDIVAGQIQGRVVIKVD